MPATVVPWCSIKVNENGVGWRGESEEYFHYLVKYFQEEKK